MTTNYTQEYLSTDTNMPPLAGAAGTMRVIWNALLVDGPGFTAVSVTSITRSGTTATATVGAADALRLRTGMLITISGATGGDASLYNITAVITFTPGGTTFTYTMAGTPTGSAAGTLLMAATQPITSITRSGTTATVTLTVADPTLRTGMRWRIAGATGGDASLYNVDAAITVISNTQFTYTTASTPSGSATGTLVGSRAPLGWSRPWAAGTNSQTYLTGDATVQQATLQLVDNAITTAKQAYAYFAETMSGDQSVTLGRCPTTTQESEGVYIRKSTTADTVVREWRLHGDNSTFYMQCQTGEATATNGWRCFGYGAFLSDRPGEAYATFIAGDFTTNVATSINGIGAYHGLGSSTFTNTHGFYISRYNTQVGGSVLGSMSNYANANTISIGVGTLALVPFPNPSTSSVYVSQMLVSDGTASTSSGTSLRGRMKGIHMPLHALPFNNGDTVTGVVQLPGVTLRVVSTSGGNAVIGQLLIDVNGPWT